MFYNYSSKNFSTEDLLKLKNKSRSGNAESQYLLATYYSDGLSIDNEVKLKPNRGKAFQLYKLAFENGHESAIVAYANYLLDEKDENYNEKLGITLLLQAIKQKDFSGAYNLAKHYSLKGHYKKAFQYYLLVEKMGGYGYFEIGMCYYFGLGTTKDISNAIKYFKALIKNEYWHSEYEFEEANYILGRLYLEGIHLKKSISKAIYHLNIANRENDHRSAQDILLFLKKSPKK
jgi:TPR repeat protein